jgi:tetratricopeptide (TPR) repeat protein
VSTFDAAAALQGDVHPRHLSGDAHDASILDKNDLAAHIRQRRALSLAMIGRAADALVDMRYVLAVAPLSMHDQYIYGRIAYLAGNLEEALAALAHAAASMPGTAVVQQWYGMLLLNRGALKEATPVLERANELQPGNGPINAALRDAYLAEQRIDRAISAAQRATRFDSGNPDNHFQLAKLYVETHQLREARSSIMAAIALKNEVVSWHMLLGDVCQQMGMFDNARSAYLSATALDPEGTKPLYALSHLLVLQGRINEAITNLEQALQRDPENASWHYELGQLYEQRGDRPAALESYRRAVQFGGDKAQYYRELAKLEAKVAPKEAPAAPVSEEIQRSAHRFQSDEEVFLAMGDVNLAQGRYDAALDQFKHALAVAPTKADVLWRFGLALWHLGSHAESRHAYETAIKQDRRCVQAYVGLAHIAQHDKQFQSALDHLRVASELEPHTVIHKIGLIETLILLKKPEECTALLPQVIKTLPADVTVLQRFAIVAMTLGITAEAISAMERAISIDDSNADSHCLLGRAYKLTGNAQKAQIAFRRALNLNPELKEAQNGLSILGPLSILRRRKPPTL